VIADRPLAGKRIIVTRARHQAGQLSAELAKLGAEAIEIPAIEIVPPKSFAPLDEALRNVRQYEWLIVTSANGVRAIHDRCEALGLWLSSLGHLKIAAVGATTARALEEAGLPVSVVPREYVAESLIKALGDETRNSRVLIVRAATARDVIPEALSKRGAQVDVVEAYRTVIPQDSVDKIAELFAGGPLDAATFSSSSTVTNFFHLLREAGVETTAAMLAISIGPITSGTLRDFGWEPAAEADPHDVAGLVAATVRALDRSSD
jgi:uroporphyrinogen-III synthase